MSPLDTDPVREAARPLSSLEQELNRRLGREKKPLRIELDIALSYHGAAGDLEPFKENLAAADVIMFEMVGWTREAERLVNTVADGNYSAEEIKRLPLSVNDPFFNEVLQAIQGTKKGLGYMDIPQGDPLNERIRVATARAQALRDGLDRTRGIKFEDALKLFGEVSAEFVQKTTIERETYIIENLARNLARVIKNRPALRTKPTLRVVLLVGAAHTGLQHALKSLHPQTVHTHETPTHVYDYLLEHKRRIRFGFPFRRDLLKKAFFEDMLGGLLMKHFVITGSGIHAGPDTIRSRQIMDSFSDAELDEYFRIRFTEGQRVKADRMMAERFKERFPDQVRAV